MQCPDCDTEMSHILGFRPPLEDRQHMGDFCITCLIYIEREESLDEARKAIRAAQRAEG